MSFRFLKSLFNPRSIAVIGASNRPRRVGRVVVHNLLRAGYDGLILPVNPKHGSVAGILTYPDVDALPRPPDLAIICTPATTIPDIIDQLGARGTRAAIVMAGYFPDSGPEHELPEQILAAARRHGVRLLGTSTLGLMVPQIGLNATFSQVPVQPGSVGFVSQSDAVGTLVLDWASTKKIGFSHFVSIGDALDIGFAEVIDFLGSDPGTRIILLYIESIQDRRGFLAAARAAARNKPVVAIKAGRGRAVNGHFPDDAVYDAVLRRAGILRVDSIDDLFGTVETLTRARPLLGDRLTVVSNGGGAGMLVEDTLRSGAYALPPLGQETRARLSNFLARDDDGAHAIDIRVDAGGERYERVLKSILETRETDLVLMMHTPTALADGVAIADAIIRTVRSVGGNVLTCWIGDESVATERERLMAAGIATFDTPTEAARAFLHLRGHRHNRDVLMQVPAHTDDIFVPDEAAASAALAGVAPGEVLSGAASTAVLLAYGVEVPAADAGTDTLPFRLSVAVDRVFGPMIGLTLGAPLHPCRGNLALALPPLNAPLAKDLIERAGLVPPVGSASPALVLALTRLSRLVCERPEIATLEIDGTLAPDGRLGGARARLRIHPADAPPTRLAIAPYPRHLEEDAILANGQPVHLRPIRPEDETRHYDFLAKMSQQDIVYRFFHFVSQLPRSEMARLTQIDYDREMAFIAERRDTTGSLETLGVVRAVADPDNDTAEFSIIVRSDLKGMRLGSTLMHKMIRYCTDRGLKTLAGEVMAENTPMLDLLRYLGFSTAPAEEPGIVAVHLPLPRSAA